jgi:hypothetical protein
MTPALNDLATAIDLLFLIGLVAVAVQYRRRLREIRTLAATNRDLASQLHTAQAVIGELRQQVSRSTDYNWQDIRPRGPGS